MLLYRHKVILALLELFDGELSNLDFQKFLFLFSIRQAKPTFDFVPYKYGCFSFQSYSDKSTLVKKGYLAEDEDKKHVLLVKPKNYFLLLDSNDSKILFDVKKEYGKMGTNALIRYIYLNHPYYATNSMILKKHLSDTEIEKVKESASTQDTSMIFSIGYEGVSREAYINKLLKNNVKVLCDVRKNALSMKYGFSKGILKETVEKFNIKYVHLPELGIDSDKRQNLEDINDYKKLFAIYKKNILPKQTDGLKKLYDIFKENKRIALTCFEANKEMCHRSIIMEYMHEGMGYKFTCNHL